MERAVPIRCRRSPAGAFSASRSAPRRRRATATRSRSRGLDRFQPTGNGDSTRPRPVDDLDQPDDERRRQHRPRLILPRRLQRRGQHGERLDRRLVRRPARPTPRTPPTRSRPAHPRPAARCPLGTNAVILLRHRQRRAHRDGWLQRHGRRHDRPRARRRPGRLRGHHQRPHRDDARLRDADRDRRRRSVTRRDVHAGERRPRRHRARRRSPAPRRTRAGTAPPTRST